MAGRLVAAFAAAAFFGSGATAQETTATAKFIGADGAEVGTATLTATPAGVLVEAEVSGLPAGQWVGFHFHENGTCDHQSGHESAGGHFNPQGKEHGYRSAGGPHAGDMPNQYVDAEGVLRAQAFNTFVSLDQGANSVKGKSLMIHGGSDDYQSQPSGKAGDRLACAVIQ
ncbi:superoxide dismutase family protein [Pseudorhizobium endolithicum]|uniref:Superoxide dismutase family protein n=1 Tax=Pseudorhizobium endolithicum TaxID=1191678 RepID=A0ABN7JQ77_9HYPH|nr:superoxide dismutase family protein [Pseudorhizobium endolithicum]CAD6407118.1 superoxide dismutase family protein [Rhizobium sp. Q54]CAD7039619.1 superoxide dismutase family protein [Pseudorhizobium endolithicum]